MKQIGVPGNPLARLFLLFLLNIACIALADARATAQNVYQTDDGHPFQVNVSCPETGLMSGEGIPLVFELRNLSDKPLFLSRISPDSPDFVPFQISIKFISHDSDNYLVQISNMAMGRDRIQLLSGECFSTPITTNSFSGKRREEGLPDGRYIIFFETKLRIGGTDSQSKPLIPVEATTEIDISPSNPETRGKVMEQLGEIMVTGRQPAATRAVDRLVAIEDPRVLSVFFRFLDACEAQTIAEGKLPTNLEPIVIRMTYTVVRDYQDIFPEGGQVAEFLQRLKNSPSVFIRENYASNLASLKSFDCFDLPGHHPQRRNLLLEMYQDRNPGIRAFVAKELGDIASPEAEQVLREMLEDNDKTVREKARESLDKRKAAKP